MPEIVLLLPNLQKTHLAKGRKQNENMTATLTYTLVLAAILLGRKAITFIQEN